MASSLQLNYIKKFTGYKNYRDITNLLPTDLIVGSQNIFIADGVRLETRGGMDFLGAEGVVGTVMNASWTLPNRIHSHYEKFVNNQGIVMPFRVWYSGTSAQGDVMETWLPIYVGGVATAIKKWYQVNATDPTIPILSAHKWYFAEWFDTVDNQNRIVFTYGSTNVSSYTGGFAPVTVGSMTTLVTANGATWQSMGFIDAPEGINTIVINVAGIPTELALTSGDFSTNTITVTNTTGIVAQDLAFQAFNNDTIDLQSTPTNFNADVCATIGNQVYYKDWRQRNVYISWAFNQTDFLSLPVYSGSSGLNDAVFTGNFTDTQTDTFQVAIDSLAAQNQTFTGTGTNSSYWDTSGYTGLGVNTYIMSIISDSVFTPTGGTTAFDSGEYIIGQTSGATFKVIFGGTNSGGAIGTQFISGVPIIGETFKGNVTEAMCVLAAWGYSNSALLYKNGVQLTGLTGMSNFPSANGTTFGVLQFAPIGDQIVAPAQLDGLNFVTTQIGGNNVGDFYTLNISATDTFSWSLNGNLQASMIPLSTTPTLLGEGISVNFQQTTGHAIGDNWVISAYPTIERGWRQVYYTGFNSNPGQVSGTARLPGEGYKLQLDSNGWAMVAQNNVMYMCDQAGNYYTIVEKFSTNLETQTYEVTKLLTEPQKKAIYPYLMGTNPNYVSVVSSEKTWDQLGGQKFILPTQFKTFSDWIKYDFYNANWLNSDQNYFERKQWFTIPEQNQVFVWDDFMKYWHTPQTFGRVVASVVVIDGQICGHSYERNETYQLFTENLNDLGLFPIKTNISLSYYDFNKRYNKKTNQAIAFDGYMVGAPVINWKINLGVYGCEGGQTGVINPTYCYPPDGASLGKTGYGYHGLGNDPSISPPHFTYGQTETELNYYLRNIVIWSDAFEQSWSITSIGELTKFDLASNTDIFNHGSPY